MKTIALFGITGRTGKPLAEMLLKQGFAIHALGRVYKFYKSHRMVLARKTKER